MSKSKDGAMPKPPKTFEEFTKQYPKLAEAWTLINEEGASGPLNARESRLVKLGVAMGSLKEGPLHSSVRKALAEGFTKKEISQAVALSASTLGLPSTAAVFTWIRDLVD